MKSLLALLLLLTITAAAQTPGQWTFQKRKASGAGFDLIGITGQNNKVFGLNSSGQLEMVSAAASSTLASLSDVALSSLADGQWLRYNSTSQEWENNTPDAYILGPLVGMTDTITGSESGIGWADGRFTLQGPEGALQMFSTGSPEESVLYWAGRLQVGSIEVGDITGEIDASLITSGIISRSIVEASLPQPFRAFVDSAAAAGAYGLTYSNTGPNGVNEPATPGTYFSQIVVTDDNAIRNQLEGRIRTASQFRDDLGLGTLATISPTGTASSSTYLRGDGSWQTISAGATPGGSSGDVQYNNAGSLGGVTGFTTTTGTLQNVNVPVSDLYQISYARLKGVTFGSSRASAAAAINFFNSTFFFHTQSSNDSSLIPAQLNLNELGFAPSVIIGWSAVSAPSSKDLNIGRQEAGTFFIRGANTTTGATVRLVERTAPASAPAANSADLWIEDNGSGKSRLMIRFATGATQQIAIEP